jgi:8-oxo-dGTP diphosphatase
MDDKDIRRELECKIFPIGHLGTYKYVVICSNYKGKWVLSKHKNRDTWETQGGHIEPNETPIECARRELFEESEIIDADIYPVCDYLGYNSQSSANGMVFLAIVNTIGELPVSEIKEISIFESLPDNLTYPRTSPKLYKEAESKMQKVFFDQTHK